ncbi:MAG: hypothetical protein AVDCRST_MAG06-2408 [uncultured Nocardioides sp.]|uniref:Uncharacterized protein n=1 Tax=uncultured Nocardioides sp. TaxID=198441 RepID=A0A6J4P405_9ACTN|nr:MAG: hypothetical protein AVDCRST_MAG06-2408 [uncultured Nocardioides sp.]
MRAIVVVVVLPLERAWMPLARAASYFSSLGLLHDRTTD